MATIIGLEERLRARATEDGAFLAHLDRISAALGITVDTVARMRREISGITPAEVAKSFRIAADEIAPGNQEDVQYRVLGLGELSDGKWED